MNEGSRIQTVVVTDSEITIVLSDARRVTAPINWFPRLATATPEQRIGWEISGGGTGVHWHEVDEDINIRDLFQGRKSPEFPRPISDGEENERVATVVSSFLRQKFAPLKHAEKLIARASGATPRTVRGWLSGDHAPQSEHLINLMARYQELSIAINDLIRYRRANLKDQPSKL